MIGERTPREVCDGDPSIVPRRLINVLNDGGPDDSLCGVFWTPGLTTNPEHSPNTVTDGPEWAADDDDRRSAVTRNERTRGVDDQAQVAARHEILNQRRAELTLHE